ncbi:hypothetical protein E1A91_D05G346800v1, partial [Gossypium mustelinum]
GQKIQGSQSIVAQLTAFLSSGVSTASPPSIVNPPVLAACWFSSVVPSNSSVVSIHSLTKNIISISGLDKIGFE